MGSPLRHRRRITALQSSLLFALGMYGSLVGHRAPPGTWRAEGLVDWQLHTHDDRAVADLDAAFAQTVDFMRRALAQGEDPSVAAARAFDRLGPVFRKWAKFGADDTEASANSRLALCELARAPLPKTI